MRPLQIKKPGNNLEAWKWFTGRIIGYENPVAYKAASEVWRFFSLHAGRRDILWVAITQSIHQPTTGSE